MSSICFNPLSFIELERKYELDISKIIKNIDLYWAHLPLEEGEKDPESLKEHSELVKQKFLSIVELNHLEPVIDKHIQNILDFSIIEEKQKVYEFIKLLFFSTVYLHDLGKINENFQAEKMKNPKFKKIDRSFASHHSELGSYLFYAFLLNKLKAIAPKNLTTVSIIITLIFSLSIRKHHSSVLNKFNEYFSGSEVENRSEFFNNCELKDLQSYLEFLGLDYSKNFHHDYFLKYTLENKKRKGFDKYHDKKYPFALYSLLKLNYSLLTLSDYLASASYMLDKNLNVEGVMNEEFKNRLHHNFYKIKSYNTDLSESSTKKPLDFSQLQTRSKDNLDALRFKMAYEIRINLLTNINKNLFFLEAPTGAGKTNMSFMVLAELLKNRKELNKAFYVFPFTTLVTQTKNSMKEVFDLSEEDYIELHSKTGFKIKDSEDESDARYGNKRKNFIDYQFANYPITLLTHIKLFDIIKSNKKHSNYLYHKLANSVIIIDEIQAYSPEHWDKIYFYMKNLSEYFNTVFIVMSATLPKIDALKIGEQIDINDFIHLNSNKNIFFSNANFAKRVQFDLEMLDKSDISLKDIRDKILGETAIYANNNNGYCKALIEFIFKKSAREFYDSVSVDNLFSDFEIKVLSGTILEPVRRKIIDDFKENNISKKKVLLICTQVVEAGVDLDFDLGFKDTSILDSDEQLAGRVNRNASKEGSKVFLFNYNKEYQIYKEDYRYQQQKKLFDKELYEEVLNTKDFDRFYTHTLNFINSLNQKESYENFHTYKNKMLELNYPKVDKDFKLIEQETISIFLNVSYNLAEYNSIQDHFKLAEKGILKGEAVFDKYCSIIENKDLAFFEKKIALTELKEVMSYFIISTYNSDKMKSALRAYAEEKYGFFYIKNLKTASDEIIYSLESGLNDEVFKSAQFI